MNPSTSRNRVLVIGFGNPGRADDGLGPALAARIAALGLVGIDVEIDYQLSIEHAEQVSRYDTVIFVDADISVSAPSPFHLRRIPPDPAPSFSSHSLSPAGTLALAKTCFGSEPEAWLLGIRPADLETFAEGLTEEGEQNLNAALEAMRALLSLEGSNHGLGLRPGINEGSFFHGGDRRGWPLRDSGGCSRHPAGHRIAPPGRPSGPDR